MTPNPPVTVTAGQHRYRLRVYYEDTDAGGIVYHASYLRFAERARTEALRDLGIAHASLVAGFGLIFVVRRVKLDYLRPAAVDDSLTVITEAVKIGHASVVLRQTVERDGAGQGAGEVLVVAEITLACVRMDRMRPARMPALWHDTLVAFVAGAPKGIEVRE